MSDNFKQSNKINKKKTPVILAVIILTITVIVISGFAYARYITSLKGQANIEIANWRFKLVDGKTETSDVIDFAVTRTDNNSEVQQGMLAPRNIWKISNRC